jgi:predicted RNA-binding Zn ribbon-like protein
MNTNAADLRLVGGHAVLDFVNTVADYRAEVLKEYLTSYSEFIRWLEHVGFYDADFIEHLRSVANDQAELAQQALVLLHELRRVLFGLFSGEGDLEAGLQRLNTWLQQAPQRNRLRLADGMFEWVQLVDEPLMVPFWDLLASASDLLVSPQRALVGVCQGGGCSWMFLDTSRKRNRRWCSMLDCGNRAKAKRHYARSALQEH